jgi:hypothetical protein
VKTFFRLLLVSCALTGVTRDAWAQAQNPPPQQPQRSAEERAAAAEAARQRDLAAVPLKVRIVLSKYQGEKRISSLPYELTVRTEFGPSNIRMITQVPVRQFGSANPANDPVQAARQGPFQYRDVGTSIDASARNLDAGRFAVDVTIQDTSIFKDDERRGAGTAQADEQPVLRSYRSQNNLIMKDGQSAELTVASDKVTGEVIKAEVSISVLR